MKIIISRCKAPVFALVFLGLAPLYAGAQSVDDLARRVNGILGASGLRRVQFSVSIVRAATVESVYEKNPRLPLIPASNMKVITSAAALETLGRDFAFTTRAGLCGDRLVVIGSGDPLLGYWDKDPGRGGFRSPEVIQAIVLRLKGMGIETISDIVLDASIFDSERVCPTWPQDQLRQKYACEVGGLNYNGNCVDISAINRGGKVVLQLDPATYYIRLINSVSAGPGRKSWFSVVPAGSACELLIQGNCRSQAGPYSVAVENPALFFGSLVEAAARQAGIAVTGQVLEGMAPEDCAFGLVAEHRTSMADCLRQMNKNSLGLAAEAFFKRLGALANADGKLGSWAGGQRALSEYLRGLGIDDAEFAIADGSGLSRENRLSARALTRVLTHLSGLPDWEFYRSSLAVGGSDGTIESHFWEPLYRGRIMAKSGYITAVRALSGIVRTQSGEYIFAFLANQAGGGARTAIDNAVKALMDWGDGRPPAARKPRLKTPRRPAKR
ncbi:MAG: D-alanyl-D-alanine carboxypeptidase/D-alanyl-D-alanine-endopeptidase [Candidatus Aminicenantes bacterium RBG_16_63_16]|nr:MAG: D-alanyl-D-alanine carboxypeptidase/D-alanyl-D-alanine-endopeptidase [Candidatus Aminicenantes bacterium RBG_16_63_16]